MNTSDCIDKLAPALLAAQMAIRFASKDAKNSHFKNEYATLESVIEAVKGPLNDAEIVFLQTPTPADDGRLNLVTRLIHSSGQWIEDTASAPLSKNDPQGYGSALTYLRRYALSSIIGVYQSDDDGNAASSQQITRSQFSDNQYKMYVDLIDQAPGKSELRKVTQAAIEAGKTLGNRGWIEEIKEYASKKAIQLGNKE